MPPDLRIVPPDLDVDPALARFSGAWGNGAWGGIAPAALAVERVHPDGAAEVVYAFGACPQFGLEPNWERRRGRIADGTLSLDGPPGVTTAFAFEADGALVGRFVPPEGYQARVWLERVPGRTAAAVGATLALPRRPPWEELRIPVRSAVGAAAGRTLQLQAFHYRTRLPGLQPLVVLNHGSTDGELPGVPCIHPFEAEARFFLARGCSVLALMRKGRGQSDGPLLEEEGENEAEEMQVDSGIEDVHAALSHMVAQPHIDPARVVVGGQSRGGLLSMAYAGRHPERVAAVLNFVGGWWGEGNDHNDFNRRQAERAGAGSQASMLWLYGERDPYYGLPFVRGLFEAFRAAGGRGALRTFGDLPGSGHALMGWQDRWEADVAALVDGLGGGHGHAFEGGTPGAVALR